MFRITRTVVSWLGSIAIGMASLTAHAGLVTNGGFDTTATTTTFTGWTTVGMGFAADRNAIPTSNSAQFDYEVATPSSLSQVLSLNLSADYFVSFYLNATTNSLVGFAATLGGIDLLAELDMGAADQDGWVEYFGTVSGFSDGELRFAYAANGINPGVLLDGVAVDCDQDDNCVDDNRVPEPGTLLLVGAALAAGSMVRRRKY